MTMRTIAEYLPEHPFFPGLDEPSIDLVAGCATNMHVRPGAYLFQEGESGGRVLRGPAGSGGDRGRHPDAGRA